LTHTGVIISRVFGWLHKVSMYESVKASLILSKSKSIARSTNFKKCWL